ncbi:MAG: hypothetical protein EBT92_12300 [Planctomycetes bacterium]|nr:hypothetical protein [Planctomycetota bacterium]NBY02190.1 hypothetical protein [Planctomycetota bacterium]
MKKNFFFIWCNRFFIVSLIWISSFGCSGQDDFKKELPPVSKDVRFTPSETSKVIPVGMDGK